MFNWISKPYAEYSICSVLSEKELRDGLKRECLATEDLFLSRRGIRAVWNQASFHFVLKEKKQEILLQPVGRGRNSLRGIIHVNFEHSSAFDETVLNIVIRPDESCRPLLFFFLVFGILFEIAGISVAMRDPKGFVFMIAPFIMFLGVCGIMALCRSMAQNEIPQIQETFETILGVIEKETSS